jgi:hypothetical protein
LFRGVYPELVEGLAMTHDPELADMLYGKG